MVVAGIKDGIGAEKETDVCACNDRARGGGGGEYNLLVINTLPYVEHRSGRHCQAVPSVRAAADACVACVACSPCTPLQLLLLPCADDAIVMYLHTTDMVVSRCHDGHVILLTNRGSGLHCHSSCEVLNSFQISFSMGQVQFTQDTEHLATGVCKFWNTLSQ